MAFVLVRESDNGRLFVWTPQPGHRPAPHGRAATTPQFEPVEGERVDARSSDGACADGHDVRVAAPSDDWQIATEGSAIRLGGTELVLPELAMADLDPGNEGDGAPLTTPDLVTADAGHLVARPGSPHLGTRDLNVRSLLVDAPNDASRPRRRWGLVFLGILLLALTAGVALSVVLHARTQRSLDGLRAALEQQGSSRDDRLLESLAAEVRREVKAIPQPNIERVIEEVRREVQAAPRPDVDRLIAEVRREVQAIPRPDVERALADAEARLAAETAKHREDLAETVRLAAAEEKPSDGDQVQLLREVLAELKARREAPTGAQGGIAPSGELHSSAADSVGNLGSAAKANVSPTAGTALELPPSPSGPPDVVFVIDASEGLDAALPTVFAEVRRAVGEAGGIDRCRVLLLDDQHLFDVPGDLVAQRGALDTTAVADWRRHADRGPATTKQTIELALGLRPAAVHLFSDTMGRQGDEVQRALRGSNRGGATVHITHFYSRHTRAPFKSIAREYGGIYTFMPVQ